MRIIIVEDELLIREGLAKLLVRINPDYELVGTAGDGIEGYGLIRDKKPDLVILDIYMPKMGGLEMLKRIRQENIECRFLVLTAHSDFNYAKQAIELGIENYLLKPIKVAELKKALYQIEEKMLREQSKESAFSLDNIFMGCLNGQLHPTDAFHQMTKEKYGFTVEENAALFIVWMGNQYHKLKREAKLQMERVADHVLDFSIHSVEADAWDSLIMIIYRITDKKSKYEYFQKSVVPVLCRALQCPLICIWREMDHMINMAGELQIIQREREWNLLFDRGALIRKEDIDAIHPLPVKYPLELEEQGKQAVLNNDREKIRKCYYKLYDYLRSDPHEPKAIKETLIRYNLFIVNTYKTIKELESELEIQGVMGRIADAISWEQIRRAMEKFFRILLLDSQEEEGDAQLSVLVKKAKKLMRRYYDQGITLEEIADRLFVSEEYLSQQLKKETGVSFSETMRKYRIEKVKQLLLNTHLKLNQIAELAGYSDPKYMSRVFKEEVGVLPNEFRKLVH
ncbi:response regulator [Faecalicatena acetigenes]|uniref:Stage 0 sporulation protein A homolog n=1 Tax=Faecalicatena acetigenes TaxID=2981790 RepID=A0ABT2T737_9FIRM|nr:MULTISPECIES: response regulator [Lachnospiraceae]MCU6746078.1 response regulator [Faecalicatena acetigenes]RGT72977.1 DNA-binding response regulator [Ruminococcus sp. AF18-22]SCG93664.1 Uncharacterized response regulatory protein SA0215 [uncultured Clostridium sp.]